MLSFQAAEMRETATSESSYKDLSIPVIQDKDCNGTRRQRQLLTEQVLENTSNPGKTMLYFGTF